MEKLIPASINKIAKLCSKQNRNLKYISRKRVSAEENQGKKGKHGKTGKTEKNIEKWGITWENRRKDKKKGEHREIPRKTEKNRGKHGKTGKRGRNTEKQKKT